MNKPKHIEKRNIKGSLVTSKTGETFFRKSHQRNIEVTAADKSKLLNGVIHNSLSGTTVAESRAIGDKGNVTSGIYKLLLDKPDGSLIKGQFKGIENDPFITDEQAKFFNVVKMVESETAVLKEHQKFLRKDIHLNNRETNKKLSFEEHLKARTMPDHGRGQYKGHMMDREVATSALAKALKMDHIPEITVKRSKVDESDSKNKLGLVVRDIPEQFVRDDTKRIVTGKEEKKSLDTLRQTDKKIGDKAVFDYLIGNLDRHHGNYFIRVNGDDTMDMLGFDHGLSFPSTNINVDKFQKGGQNREHPGKDVPVTSEFAQNLIDLIGTPELETIRNFITENVGGNEEAAFMERLKNVSYGIFKERKLSVSQILNI